MDLVLPCSTVVLTDTLVLPTDGANCRDTILVTQSLSIKSWPKKSHTMNFFVEGGLKNFISVSLNGLLHGMNEYRNKDQKDRREEKSLLNDKTPNLIIEHRSIQ